MSYWGDEITKYKDARRDPTNVRPPGKGKHKKPRPWKVVWKTTRGKRELVCYYALTKEAAQAWIDKQKRRCPLFEHWPESLRIEQKKRWEESFSRYKIVGPDT